VTPDFATLLERRTDDGRVLILRTCDADMRSYNGFQWPESGAVEAPDWKPIAECGNGLHGLLWGCGNARLLNHDEDARWLIIAADPVDVIDVYGDKVKCRRAEVLLVGTRDEAIARLLAEPASADLPIVFGTATAGDRGTATAGDEGTATAGYEGTATAGDRGTATAGDEGTATAGYRGTATAGDRGTATAGDRGTATAGEGGVLIFKWWDEAAQRYRVKVWPVGEDIEPNIAYRLNTDGSIMPAGDK
jgi:hypothetical protein